jgi:N-acetyl-alpha-D-muramate 1-phosphate uridylyltransferase
MDAMILAAGLGTRLRPLTDDTPKALVTVGGTPMLERIARRLIAAGVDRLIVNVHHHAQQIRDFVAEREGFGIDVRISDEPDAPLETGGGLLHARPHFRSGEPFFLHNVDVVSEVDLAAMYRAHEQTGALVTLAVSDRPSSRLLEFDEVGLRGRVDRRADHREAARPAMGETRARAFAGIHVVSPAFFDLIEERGAFSIMAPYLRLAGAGQPILPFDIGAALWLEVGDPERLERARRFLRLGNGHARS